MEYTYKDIYSKFKDMYNQAKEAYEKQKLGDHTAFYLATCINNLPSVRTLLLKNFSEEGFVFFTNYNSRKSKEVLINNHVAMLFHWIPMNCQINIEGVVSKVSAEESDKYFKTRPVESRIGAWASSQSDLLDKYEDLESRVDYFKAKFAGETEIPRPPHWGGFIIKPNKVEFWHDKAHRLHLRESYSLNTSTNTWKKALLNP